MSIKLASTEQLKGWSLNSLICSVSPEKIVEMFESLTDEEAVVLKYHWPFWARPNQLPPKNETEWLTWFILAGRGFGKTRCGAEWVRDLVENKNYGRIALVAEDAGDARDVMIEGESGLLAVCPPWNKPTYRSSSRRLTWPNGARATIYSAEDPESLRGPQHDAAWIDELAKFRYQEEVFSQLQFGLRLGRNPKQCITTTPRPTPLIKSLIARASTVVTKGHTFDNLSNLSPNFREEVVSAYEGTRLGRQELAAEILDDNPNALFHASIINMNRMTRERVPEDQHRVVIGVDPPATGNENSDECGIVAVARDLPNPHIAHYYVLKDASVQGRSPEQWANQAISVYHMLKANAIVAEVNMGGDLVEHVLKSVDPSVNVIKVRASRGKWTRAEPVAALHEQGRIHHIGRFDKLEEQMIDFDPSGTVAGGKSPDRMDAMVWAVSELMGKRVSDPRIRRI